MDASRYYGSAPAKVVEKEVTDFTFTFEIPKNLKLILAKLQPLENGATALPQLHLIVEDNRGRSWAYLKDLSNSSEVQTSLFISDKKELRAVNPSIFAILKSSNLGSADSCGALFR